MYFSESGILPPVALSESLRISSNRGDIEFSLALPVCVESEPLNRIPNNPVGG